MTGGAARGARRLRGSLLPWLAAAMLAGCSSVPTPSPSADIVSGRMAVDVAGRDARNVSAAFTLGGTAQEGFLELSGPLGTTMASARWSPAGVMLTTPTEQRRFADLGGLSREVLGEPLPLEALPDWLRGRPWPGAPSRAVPTLPGFEQLGWTVDLARFDRGAVLAQRMALPVVTVRAVLDR